MRERVRSNDQYRKKINSIKIALVPVIRSNDKNILHYAVPVISGKTAKRGEKTLENAKPHKMRSVN